ncbi:MAG TPA: hypothetical protein VI300_32035 [Solirubrobacter sp.]
MPVARRAGLRGCGRGVAAQRSRTAARVPRFAGFRAASVKFVVLCTINLAFVARRRWTGRAARPHVADGFAPRFERFRAASVKFLVLYTINLALVARRRGTRVSDGRNG